MNILNISKEVSSVATKILIDGKEPNCKIHSYKLEQVAGEPPVLTLEIYGDFDINTDVSKIKFEVVKDDN